jgi:hypothetical protein
MKNVARWYLLYENGQTLGAAQATEEGIKNLPMQLRADRLGTLKGGEEPPVFTTKLLDDTMPFEEFTRGVLIGILAMTAEANQILKAAMQAAGNRRPH